MRNVAGAVKSLAIAGVLLLACCGGFLNAAPFLDQRYLLAAPTYQENLKAASLATEGVQVGEFLWTEEKETLLVDEEADTTLSEWIEKKTKEASQATEKSKIKATIQFEKNVDMEVIPWVGEPLHVKPRDVVLKASHFPVERKEVEITSSLGEETPRDDKKLVEMATPWVEENLVEKATPRLEENLVEKATPRLEENLVEKATPRLEENLVETTTPCLGESLGEKATPWARESTQLKVTHCAEEKPELKATPRDGGNLDEKETPLVQENSDEKATLRFEDNLDRKVGPLDIEATPYAEEKSDVNATPWAGGDLDVKETPCTEENLDEKVPLQKSRPVDEERSSVKATPWAEEKTGLNATPWAEVKGDIGTTFGVEEDSKENLDKKASLFDEEGSVITPISRIEEKREMKETFWAEKNSDDKASQIVAMESYFVETESQSRETG